MKKGLSQKEKNLSNPFFRVGKIKSMEKILTTDQNKLICKNLKKQ